MNYLTIGELAKKTDVSSVSIRHYERLELLPTVMRKSSGYRLYSENMIRRVRFIKNAQSVGFTLKEIKELLSLQEHPKTTSQQIKSLIQTKLDTVQEKVITLQNIIKGLKQLSTSCDGKMPLSECPILEALYGDGECKSCQAARPDKPQGKKNNRKIDA